MRVDVPTLVIALLGVAGVAQGADPAIEKQYERLRLFAQKELGSADVRYVKPSKRILPGNILLFDAGWVHAKADPAIVAQLRVELLRRVPLFDGSETKGMTAELEIIVRDFLATLDRLDREGASHPEPSRTTTESNHPAMGYPDTPRIDDGSGDRRAVEPKGPRMDGRRSGVGYPDTPRIDDGSGDRRAVEPETPHVDGRRSDDRFEQAMKTTELGFRSVLRKYAMAYAERHRLNLDTPDAFGHGTYIYINGRRRDLSDVSYEEAKKAVAVQFDKGLVGFVRPYQVVERRYERENGIQRDFVAFSRGRVAGLDSLNPAVADLFCLELLRRYPNVNKDALERYLRAVEGFHEFYYRKQEPIPPRLLDCLLEHMEEEAAKSMGMVRTWRRLPEQLEEQPGGQPSPGPLPAIRATVETDDSIVQILYTDGLTFRYYEDMTRVPARERYAIRNGDERAFAYGNYAYELTTRDNHKSAGTFNIPKWVDKRGRLVLR